MTSAEKKESLHVLLESKQMENLKRYQREKGLENRSQAVRHLLNNLYDEKKTI